MPQRRYDMSKRALAVEATKRRILEATMHLHTQQGVLATSWEEIAERAEVAPATVYRHFPTLDELVPACGALTLDLLDLPSAERAAELIRGALSNQERVARLVKELFSIYERGERVFWAVRRDRGSVPALQEGHERIEESLDGLREAALGPLGLSPVQKATVVALTDYEPWRALRDRGLDEKAATEATTAVLAAWLRAL
jgi:AcrR family transcriptional regulator